jgi:integrating conjugative element protein (TIGR03765 family)
MKPISLAVMACFSAPALAAGLIVVEDRGGDSALPYYEALASSEKRAGLPVPRKASPIRSPSEAEAALLPVRSPLLSPGEEPSRAIHAPGLTPLFLIGDDARSRVWLTRNYAELRNLRAVGLVVNVATPEALAALRRLAPDISLSPASGDDLARRLGLSHYPVRITATGITP